MPARHIRPSARVGLGVLRGGLADDGAWRLDPARPAVLVGTVDMVGSRLLFSGYGDGRSRRAMHAGLLGHDAVVLLDEAHLAPAFAALLRDIERMQAPSRVPHHDAVGDRRLRRDGARTHRMRTSDAPRYAGG